MARVKALLGSIEGAPSKVYDCMASSNLKQTTALMAEHANMLVHLQYRLWKGVHLMQTFTPLAFPSIYFNHKEAKVHTVK